MTSIRCTSPVGEKLARTWSPSLMSDSDAGWPFFITCVESLTFSLSDSWLLDRSSLSTLPVTCALLEPEALPGAPVEPEPIDPLLLLPDDPVPRSELDEPLEPDPI